MNKKGQGGGVFQLLIAAVVALAIVGVLLGIIGGIPIPGGQDAATTARTTLQDAYTSLGTPKTSTKIKMNQNDIITNRGVGTDLGLDYSQILVGYDSDLAGLFELNGAALTYISTSSRDVRIVAVCSNASELEDYCCTGGATLETAWNIDGEYDDDGFDDSPTLDGCFVGVVKG